ncbi:F-box/kelch-repeat protein SKIP25-like [Amaranthus tricolor]|uniref:F-box/kelch-repeat protein SKIP25-like n=1 Tax=Amaranthus tricolor TaxID=29722 RepID=UPI002590354A|nr:F-box/kelch-repeat protein SKIP25-like [Amaranthus tricolor]
MARKSSKLSYHGSPHHNQDKDHDQNNNNQQQLIPGLPDHISHLILSKIPPLKLYSICHPWRNFIYSLIFPPFYSLYAVLTPDNLITNSSSNFHQQFLTPISFFIFDPISSRWAPLPPPPPFSLLVRYPSFISRDLPVQSVTVGDKLAVVAGTTQHLAPAVPKPLVFDPITHGWDYGPRVPVPRRWCATGSSSGSLYIASGVGSHFSSTTARSVERWDPSKPNGPKWEKLTPLKDGRFSREASEAVGLRGQLYLVNVKGNAAKQGAVYSLKKNTWKDMKEGMVAGWRGPAASMAEEVMYMVDESKGTLKMYNEEKDEWVNVMESDKLRGAQQMAARGGRLCVVCNGGSEIVVVDVVATPPRLWAVEPPKGFNVAAVHILPRMSRVHSGLNT